MTFLTRRQLIPTLAVHSLIYALVLVSVLWQCHSGFEHNPLKSSVRQKLSAEKQLKAPEPELVFNCDSSKSVSMQSEPGALPADIFAFSYIFWQILGDTGH